MIDVDTTRNPLVPVNKEKHREISDFPIPWVIEAFCYIFVAYLFVIGFTVIFNLTYIVPIGMGVFLAFVGPILGRYIVVFRKFGLSYEEYKQIRAVPTNLKELREKEHQKLKELEVENISAIEEALNSLSYHTISIEKDGKGGEFTINIEDKSETPKDSDSILTGEKQVYPNQD